LRKLALLIAASMLAALPAMAQESPSEAPADVEEEMTLFATYDATEFELLYSLEGEDACSAPESSCIAVDVVGDNGQVNHGTITSNFVHSLAPGRGKGCLVRQIARSQFGKGDEQVKTGGNDDGEEEEAPDGAAPDDSATETEDAQADRADYRQFCRQDKGPKKVPPGQAKKQERAGANSGG
jgi:hypothetical protein